MDYEKLGVFYLGRCYDLANRKSQEKLLLYDSKDLTTHAVCVGMTGSGKTGLCLALLEEAAIDGIPAIVIDPKGDLGNLLLTFPELRPEDFAPWVNLDEAARKGIPPEQYPAQQAELWRNGLSAWQQDGARIRRLREAVDIAIYTPGSSAGLPVSALKSFDAPGPAILEDRELLRERIGSTVSSLLALAGIDADPVQSREHILLSTLLDHAWRDGRNLDVAALVEQIQTPPFNRIGVLDLEAFYPGKERFKLVLALNNLLASPGFEAWMEGEALDIGHMLHTPQGKPRVSIFSIAHLNDAERMFFVSLLLNQTLGWMRAQSGTTSLRALLYMDEIFGYFPPTANPPSKKPLLTLLKQARAFGLGVVLATQNPVDLDYKGLANCGTWFIGRLQTERDKMRVLEGLEGAAAGAGAGFDRQRMEQTLAALGNRVFLMNNVHDDAPEIFETRWCMSYLRGPLTRDQIRRLMEARKAAAPAASSAAAAAALPRQEAALYVLGAARLHFLDSRTRTDHLRDVAFVVPVPDHPAAIRWDDAEEAGFDPDQLPDHLEAAPPAAATLPKTLQKDFLQWLATTQTLQLFTSRRFQETSKPGESEQDFRRHLEQVAREERDRAVEKLRQKYAPKLASLEDRIHRAQQAMEREQAQVQQARMSAALSIGQTLLGAFLGRKAVSATTLGRASSSARTLGRTYKESQDVGRAAETVERLQQQLEELNAAFESEVAALQSTLDPMTAELETITIRPRKTSIQVRRLALLRQRV